jgi:hypothetical protein
VVFSPEAPQGGSMSSLHADLLRLAVRLLGDKAVLTAAKSHKPFRLRQPFGGGVKGGIGILEPRIQPSPFVELAPNVL